jgi:hypothetical protein
MVLADSAMVRTKAATITKIRERNTVIDAENCFFAINLSFPKRGGIKKVL